MPGAEALQSATIEADDHILQNNGRQILAQNLTVFEMNFLKGQGVNVNML